MPNFGIAQGHNASMEAIEDFVPYQPLTPGLQYTRRSPTAGGVEDEGPFIPFTFGRLSEDQYRALLLQAGLLIEEEPGVFVSEETAEVTLYAQDENFHWLRLNGTAIRPVNVTRRGFFLQDVPLLVIDIHEAF